MKGLDCMETKSFYFPELLYLEVNMVRVWCLISRMLGTWGLPDNGSFRSYDLHTTSALLLCPFSHREPFCFAPLLIRPGSIRLSEGSSRVQDQQKKEKLMKAVDMYKKEIQRSFSPAYCESKSHFLEQRKEISINRNNQEFHQIREKVPFSQPAQHVHEERRGAQVKSPVLIARDTMRRIEQEGHCQGEMVTIQTRRSQTRHGNETPRKKAYQDPEKKAYSGDILDKHAAWFTSTKLCFKPRLLKKSAQSFLSNSRHYKSPKKTNAAPQPRSDHHGAEHLGEVERSLENKDLKVETTSQEQNSGTENENLPGVHHSQHLEQSGRPPHRPYVNIPLKSLQLSNTELYSSAHKPCVCITGLRFYCDSSNDVAQGQPIDN
ncbi:hypothetical protein XELAEV_18026224mg [Xenopus laevis]|uniref:Uncharacterized protein n=1 Tax=Xenopus laevis TaxID=8355 RepID=A0A974HJ34_XENLA|nr:hypothetical protein XELAEV_18026224mg [Xenopus laevis]